MATKPGVSIIKENRLVYNVCERSKKELTERAVQIKKLQREIDF